MDDFLEARYEQDPSVVYREIAGEAILVPIRGDVADMDSIYKLDGIGSFVWGLMDGRRSVAEIGASVLDEYDTDPETAEADLGQFLQQLEQIGAIRRV